MASQVRPLSTAVDRGERRRSSEEGRLGSEESEAKGVKRSMEGPTGPILGDPFRHPKAQDGMLLGFRRHDFS